MKNKTLKLPILIIAISVIVAIIACLLTCIIKTPTITTHDFNYSVTYKLDGETKTVNGVYRCEYSSENENYYPLERYYSGHFLEDNSGYPESLTIAKKGDLQLRIIIIFADDYLMGDKHEEVSEDPYLAVYDKEGCEYTDYETLEQFDAELVSWEMPNPIENTFKFNGFSYMHALSMIVMLVIGVLAIISTIIFVKKDSLITLRALDKISIPFNFIIGFLAIPFITLVVFLMELFVTGDEFIYQLDLCIPALTAFTIATSIALRRKGYSKLGFIIQFIGPALFLLSVILEELVMG